MRRGQFPIADPGFRKKGINMKKCVTVWNYPGDRVENAYRFRELGFDAISWLGSEFAALTPEDDERVVAMLKTTGMQFTVHSRLPDPQKPEDCEAFRREIRRVAAWQQKYGLLYSYTFDFWTDEQTTLPYLGEALATLRGMNIVMACEDIPLSKSQFREFEKYVHPRDKFGILMDIGHMNIRQRCMELIEPEDFVASFEALQLPIIEVHLHDNKSFADEHMYLGYGTVPLKAVVTGLKKKRFDGFATVEIIQRDWSADQTFQYAVDSRDMFLRCWEETTI